MEVEETTRSPSGGAAGERSNGDKTKYKGVRKRKWGKWVSEIRLPNSRERIWLGSYDSPEKAARAFDAALFCLRGRSANFNFPNCPPDIPGAGSMTRDEIRSAAARFANEAPVIRSEEASPSSEIEVAAVDWSFLNLWESNEGVSDFGIYSGLQYDNMVYPDQEPMDHDGDGNDGEAYAQTSFLWNF